MVGWRELWLREERMLAFSLALARIADFCDVVAYNERLSQQSLAHIEGATMQPSPFNGSTIMLIIAAILLLVLILAIVR